MGDIFIPYVYSVPPQKRHFFLDISGKTVRIINVKNLRPGTWNEARALAEYLQSDNPLRAVYFISDGPHLKRVKYIFSRFLKQTGLGCIHLFYISLNEVKSNLDYSQNKWKLSYNIRELSKYLLYIGLWQIFRLCQFANICKQGEVIQKVSPPLDFKFANDSE